MDVSSSLRPFPSPHVALNAGLQVASEKISIKTAKKKNSDVELQAYAGNLFAWIIMVYIIKYFNVPQRPHTQCLTKARSKPFSILPTIISKHCLLPTITRRVASQT